MDRLDTMRIFVSVADRQGFAAAARDLNLSPPAVTRAIAALETRLGARLLERTTRAVRPTEAGLRFLADARRILAEVAEAEASATGSHGRPAGTLGVTAPVMFGRLHVAPAFFDFLAEHRAVNGRLLLLDRVVDLMEEGLHVAVRIAQLPDSALTAIRCGQVRRVVCAAPAYLERRGPPRRPEDLTEHDAIAFSSASQPGPWLFPAAGGGLDPVLPAHQMLVNTADAAVAAAVAGHGVVRVLSYQAAADVAAGRLVHLLEDFEPPPVPVQVVHLDGRRAAARIRAFVDFMVDRLRTNPVLQV
ncbi:LysR family transcriptional regulator [Zavarzinia sp.]|uniref:LysR family transcriptional regulator n=1 Tax=Zavarzinia sp. TaxID=2027920 RepID=UPI0035660AB3